MTTSLHRDTAMWPVAAEPNEATPFGAALRRYREARRMSQSRLASRAGFDHSYVSRIEGGYRTPSRDAIVQFAKALGLSGDERDELLTEAGFAPNDVAFLLASEPDVQRVLAILQDDTLPEPYRESVRGVLRLVVEQARVVSAVQGALEAA